MGKVKRKIETPKLPPKALRTVAYHEAGHVAARAFTKLEIRHIREVSIVANARTWGRESAERSITFMTLHLQPKDLAWQEGLKLLLCELAGSAAGEKIDPLRESLPNDWREVSVAIEVYNNDKGSDYARAVRVCEIIARPEMPAHIVYEHAVKWTREMIEIPAVWAFIESLAERLHKEKIISGEDPRLLSEMGALPPIWEYPEWERRLMPKQ